LVSKYKKIKISRSADQGHIGKTDNYRWVERSNSDRHDDDPVTVSTSGGSLDQTVVLSRGLVALRWLPFSAKFRSARCLRRLSPYPFHPFAHVVEERVTSEVPHNRIRPTTRFGAWPLFLSQNRTNDC